MSNILPASDVSVNLSIYPTGTSHASHVNDGSDSTYCYKNTSGSATDELAVSNSNPIPAGATITQVLLKFRYGSNSGYNGACAGQPFVKIGSNQHNGASQGNGVNTQWFSYDITNFKPGGANYGSGNDWVRDDFASSLHIGYALTGDQQNIWEIVGYDEKTQDPIYGWVMHYYEADCYEVYLDVTWIIIDESPTGVSFEDVLPNTERDTGLTAFTVTNNSTFAINILISGTDMTGGTTWTLADDGNPGNNYVGIKAGLEEASSPYYTIVVKKTNPNTLKASLGASQSQRWGLKLFTPTNNPFSDTETKTGYITLTGITPPQ